MHIKWVSSLVLAASLAGVAGTGCYVEPTGTVQAGVVVESEPPPPQQEVVEVRPGFVYLRGRHYWVNNHWEWRGGRYERERPGYYFEEGRWDRRGRGHVWVEGRWRRR